MKVEHGGSSGEFLARMRDYMPPVQRGLIAWVTGRPGLRSAAEVSKLYSFIFSFLSTTTLKSLLLQVRGLGERYNECVRALGMLRTQHLVLVSRYITSQVTRE